MWRSAEDRAGAALLVAVLAGCLVTGTATAGALPQDTSSPSPPPSPSPSSPPTNASPAEAARSRVQPLRSHGQQLRANVVDLAGTARVTSSPNRIAVTLNCNILFAKDSAAIQPKARARLAEVGAQLKAAGPGTLQITGYTDDLGSAEHGLELSTQRASAVRKALGASLEQKTVSITGRGEADPVVPNISEANRARNRRVEILFTRK